MARRLFCLIAESPPWVLFQLHQRNAKINRIRGTFQKPGKSENPELVNPEMRETHETSSIAYTYSLKCGNLICTSIFLILIFIYLFFFNLFFIYLFILPGLAFHTNSKTAVVKYGIVSYLHTEICLPYGTEKAFSPVISLLGDFFIRIKLGFCACLNWACRYVAVSLLLPEAGTLDQSKSVVSVAKIHLQRYFQSHVISKLTTLPPGGRVENMWNWKFRNDWKLPQRRENFLQFKQEGLLQHKGVIKTSELLIWLHKLLVHSYDSWNVWLMILIFV